MTSMTPQEVKETREYWGTLTQEQKDWVKHKCNWEQRPRPFILNEYRGYIDSLLTPNNKEG